MASDLYVGDVAPRIWEWIITLAPEGRGLTDLSLVTGATVTVTYPSGATATWSVALSNQTTTTLTCTRTLQADDLTQAGNYKTRINLTTNAGVYQTTSSTDPVLSH